MFDVYLSALQGMLAVSVIVWLISIVRHDVSIVDSLWSLFFLLAAAIYAPGAHELGPRGVLVLGLTAIWALRLSIYITARNFGEPEDYRYRAIRARHEPYFALKSLLIVFALQALLAWIISIPLLPAIRHPADLGLLDAAAVLLWLVGMVFEAGGDYQLARFRADRTHAGQVMNRGLWRYTRHPNYFGNACIWWGYYLFALAAGAWWTIYAPALMTFLLLRVSGVAMLEKTIVGRRPGYAEYIATTNAFFPGPPRERRAAGQEPSA